MNAIVVTDRAWAIGRDGDLLFSLPTDMRRFRSMTLDGTVILGRKTLDSFPGGKPLPRRRNIVITHNADFDREGWHYTLLDVTRQENSKSDEKDYAETYTLNMDTKDMEKIMPQLAAERTVTTEDGYTGTLVLDTSSIKVEAAGYNTSTKTVTATRTYPNLSDADISFVPKSITDNGRTMELADVQWQESDGFYHASATYTGKVSNKYATGYIVTADYSGGVVRTTMDDTIYTAIFSGTPIQPERSAFDWRYLLILPAGAGVAGLVVLGRNWLKKRKNEKKWEEYTK